ncbi:hypothetical protein GCM10020229_39420 [Kitasatospora albolonga]
MLSKWRRTPYIGDDNSLSGLPGPVSGASSSLLFTHEAVLVRFKTWRAGLVLAAVQGTRQVLARDGAYDRRNDHRP